MASSAGEQAASSRKDVLERYLSYYRSEWAEGPQGVCVDRQVREAARGVLLREGPENSFSLLPFQLIMSQQLLQAGEPDLQNNISVFIRAAELLEMLCVNLLLFPWKKEIRTLKKFTAHFVYYIEPGLPNQSIKNILHSIGYGVETDTEYILVDDADPDVAKTMGFELFLARLACEYLLETMGQKSQAECLEIIHKRAASHNVLGNVPEEERQSEDQDVLENEPLHSRLNPDTKEEQKSLQSLDPSSLEVQKVKEKSASASEETRPPRSFISEDKSILEMQENYPDLAFRQKPIFRKNQKSLSLKVKDRDRSSEAASAQLHTGNTELSGPKSIALHMESTTAPRLQIPEQVQSTEPRIPEEKQPFVLRVGKVLQNTGFSSESSDDCLVTELTEKICKLQMKEFSADEPLKYPIEETAQENPPVLCLPSQPPSITDCGSCSGSAEADDPIKEPPHSFYIPNCLSGCSAALAAPKGHDQDCSSDRSPTQQPEDEIAQTFVIL